MKRCKKILLFVGISMFFSLNNSMNAAILTDDANTVALWHMDGRVNHTDPPSLPWFIPDDDSANPGRDFDLELVSNSNPFVPGLEGNAAEFDGTYRFRSDSGKEWVNADTLKIELDFNPDILNSSGQALVETTNAFELRLVQNSSGAFGRLQFIVVDESLTVHSVFSQFKPVASLLGSWNHAVATVDLAGNVSVELVGATVSSASTTVVGGIHDAFSDGRIYVGGTRTNTRFYDGLLDEVKISTIPEPATMTMVLLGLGGLLLRRNNSKC